MKKNLLFLFVIFSVSLFAQENITDAVNTSKVKKKTTHSSKSAVVIWEEDFGGGFPSGWSTYTANTGAGNNGTPSAGNTAEAPWKHSMVGSWGYWNSVGTNASGNPTAAADAINSTTAANGFLISDIDSANHWNGNSGSSSGSTYHYIESYFTTSAIDLTGWPNVSLEFEHNFRLNNSVNLVVSVSSDSINWTDYNVQGNATNNQESADPEFLSLNISTVGGNQPSVYVRVGWTGRVYYWMIDDMKIVETPDHRLSLSEAEYGGWNTTPTTDGFGMEYTFYPMKQAIANPYNFEGIVANLGALPQNTKINVDVSDNTGSSVFNTTSIDVLLNPQDTNVFVGTNKFTPSSTGLYTFKTWASSADTISDTITKSSVVTDNVYGRDNGSDDSEYGLGRSCGGMVIGTYYDIYDNDELSSISVFIKDNSVAGADVFAMLYEIDANNEKVYLTQSEDYTLQSSDIGNWVTIPFDDTETLWSGITYMAAVGGYASPVDTSVVGMSQYTYATTCYIQKNGCLTGTQSFGSWYWTSRVPMIRMNFFVVSSIEENVFDGQLSVYPNPSKGVFTLEMFNVNSEKYTITVSNVLGKTIHNSTDEINSTFKKEIDLSAFSKGVYMIRVENSNSSITKKLIIE